MKVVIRGFEVERDLGVAAELLAVRHGEERSVLGMLPVKFAGAAGAREAILADLRRHEARGWVAVVGEKVVGFMIGYELVEDLLGRTGWVSLAGHGVVDVEIYHELYGAMAEHWIKRGIFKHYVLVSAANGAALGKWFGLGFGQQQGYGVADLAACEPVGDLPAGMVIREATADDEAIAQRIYDTNSRFQLGSPMLAITTPEYLAANKQGYVEALTDESTFWLALVDGEVAGYQIYYPAEGEETNLIMPPKTIEFPAGASLAGKRGMGVGTVLTRYALWRAREAGYRYCLTDWRTTNPLSSRFWPKMGFVPVAYRLMRRVDERVLWARQI
ncbi:MAG TPA: GNAT family N-acetyltransferase [Anaerolineae bacterium]|nr:GNAT family N-acetyltransferase [Anaerolineae bacterium]